MKHTPGPWHWHDLGTDWVISDSAGNSAIVAPDRKPTPANARLIAAAPDLLAALEMLNSLCAKQERFPDRCRIVSCVAPKMPAQQSPRRNHENTQSMALYRR